MVAMRRRSECGLTCSGDVSAQPEIPQPCHLRVFPCCCKGPDSLMLAHQQRPCSRLFAAHGCTGRAGRLCHDPA